MRRFTIAFGLVSGLAFLGLPGSAFAQNKPAAEIAGGGYSFMRDYRTKENYPAGWFASGAYNINDWLAAVGEVGGSYKSYDVTFNSTKFSTNTHLHTFLVGPRYSRRLGGVTPFGQLLVGAARETGGVTIFRPSIATAETKLALQPGGGVYVPLTGRLSGRLGADYRRIFAKRKYTQERNNNEFRFVAGVAVGFGSR